MSVLIALINGVIVFDIIAFRLTRQEQSAPTLGNMLEKVLPGNNITYKMNC